MVRTTAVKTIRFIDLVLHRSTFGAVIHSYRMAAVCTAVYFATLVSITIPSAKISRESNRLK